MKNSKGFTLIEVIIVVAIIGIMSAIAIPNIINWLPNYRLKAAARDLYSTMQMARIIAVKANKSTAVVFTNSKYSLCDDWSSGSCIGSTQDTNFAAMGNGIGYGHGNATSAVGTNFDNEVTFSADVVIFNSQGLANPGYVYLDHQKNTTTYAVGSLSSGAVRILKWQGGGWQ